ncbi:UFM1 specific ligase 1 [Dermatophagoides pteronyssinus]|uniref:UFM1 specific ligase 1 n=1 Tax=Dermatophagoides pteronyssinus TaxID=6956 RepID=UPI003F67A7E0
MAADWEEVKKLASDFQRAQQMSSALKLSERNCVDIVKKLIEKKLINVLFTNDGKEYLTSDHLRYEIEGELYAAGGRISIPDLVTILNVDYSHVEASANQIARNSGGEINIVLGQLVSRDYKDNLASEIDLHLQESGSLSIGDLSKQYDLPADFLANLIRERLNTLIQGQLDNDARIIYTYDYLARYESQIIGIFSAITKSIALQTIINRYNISEKILTSTLDKLLEKKRILGVVSGPTFIPDIYSKNQQEYVNSFFKHNQYLDYSTLIKLGISNPQTYLQKKFGDQLCYLNTCAVDQMLSIQLETSFEDVIQNKSFVDIFEMIPSVLTTVDTDLLIKKTLENKNYANSIEILCDTYVTSKSFLEQAKEYFEQIKKDRAEEDLKNGVLQNYFFRSKSSIIKSTEVEDSKKFTKDDHGGRKGKGKSSGGSTGGGGGGATQKREVKTKAVKKKYKPGQKGQKSEQEQDDSGVSELEFLSMEQVINVLTEKLTDDVSTEFIESIAESIIEDLRKSYEVYAKELFITRNAEMNKTKKSFAELQSFVNSNYSKILLFNRSIQFIGESSQCFKDLQSRLAKHLLRTLATDIVNELVSFFNDEILSENISLEARTKIINKLDFEFKNEFIKLNESLNSNEVQAFIDELEECAAKIDLMIKKIDAKKEKLILSEHQQSLLLQLNECQDSILCLHILVLLVFQMVHHHMLHASGKFVPQILQFLQKSTNEEIFQAMKECQDDILQFIAVKDDQAKSDTKTKLNQSIGHCKQLLNDFIAKKLPLSKV